MPRPSRRIAGTPGRDACSPPPPSSSPPPSESSPVSTRRSQRLSSSSSSSSASPRAERNPSDKYEKATGRRRRDKEELNTRGSLLQRKDSEDVVVTLSSSTEEESTEGKTPSSSSSLSPSKCTSPVRKRQFKQTPSSPSSSSACASQCQGEVSQQETSCRRSPRKKRLTSPPPSSSCKTAPKFSPSAARRFNRLEDVRRAETKPREDRERKDSPIRKKKKDDSEEEKEEEDDESTEEDQSRSSDSSYSSTSSSSDTDESSYEGTTTDEEDEEDKDRSSSSDPESDLSIDHKKRRRKSSCQRSRRKTPLRSSSSSSCSPRRLSSRRRPPSCRGFALSGSPSKEEKKESTACTRGRREERRSCRMKGDISSPKKTERTSYGKKEKGNTEEEEDDGWLECEREPRDLVAEVPLGGGEVIRRFYSTYVVTEHHKTNELVDGRQTEIKVLQHFEVGVGSEEFSNINRKSSKRRGGDEKRNRTAQIMAIFEDVPVVRGRKDQAGRRSRKRRRHGETTAAANGSLRLREEEEGGGEFYKEHDRCSGSSSNSRMIKVEVRWLFDREDIESHAWWEGGVSVSSRDLPQQAWEVADSDKCEILSADLIDEHVVVFYDRKAFDRFCGDDQEDKQEEREDEEKEKEEEKKQKDGADGNGVGGEEDEEKKVRKDKKMRKTKKGLCQNDTEEEEEQEGERVKKGDKEGDEGQQEKRKEEEEADESVVLVTHFFCTKTSMLLPLATIDLPSFTQTLLRCSQFYSKYYAHPEEEDGEEKKKRSRTDQKDDKMLVSSSLSSIQGHECTGEERTTEEGEENKAKKMKEREEFSSFSIFQRYSQKAPDAEDRRQRLVQWAIKRLQLDDIPHALPCRDKEIRQVRQFIRSSVLQGGNGEVLYISGLPGTGKTATVQTVLRDLQLEVELGILPPFDTVSVNAMRLPHPDFLFSVLHRRFFGVRARNTQQAFAALDRYFTSFSSSSFVSRRPSSRVHTPAEHTLGDAIGGGGEEEDEVERHGSEKEKEGRTKSEDEEEEEEEEGRRSGKRRSTGRKREREEPKKKKNSSSSSSSSVSSRSPQGKEKISREDRYRDSIYRNGKRCEVEELCSQRSDDFLNKREEEDSEREDEGEEEKENEVYYSYYYGKKGRRRKKGSILHRDWTTRIVKGRKRRTCVLVVDEIDCLVTPKQRVLYTLFDWPTQPHAKLVVLGIANTIDLPDRLLSSRCSSRVGFGRLVFNPYTREEIETIILARLRECKDLFDEAAIKVCARKVANFFGDLRRALQVLRRALEMRQSHKGLIRPADVARAASDLFDSPMKDVISKLPWAAKLLLFSLLQAQRVDGGGVPLLQLKDRFQGFLRISASRRKPSERLREYKKVGDEESPTKEQEEESRMARDRKDEEGQEKEEEEEYNLRLDFSSDLIKYEHLKPIIDMFVRLGIVRLGFYLPRLSPPGSSYLGAGGFHETDSLFDSSSSSLPNRKPFSSLHALQQGEGFGPYRIDPAIDECGGDMQVAIAVPLEEVSSAFINDQDVQGLI